MLRTPKRPAVSGRVDYLDPGVWQPFRNLISQLDADEAVVLAPYHQHGCLKLVCAWLKVLLAHAEVLEVRQKHLLVALPRTICRELLAYLSRDGVSPVKSFQVRNLGCGARKPAHQGLAEDRTLLGKTPELSG